MALVIRSVSIGTRSLSFGGVGGIGGVTRDPGNLNYFPANNTEWTILMAAAGLSTGNPSSVWNSQEATGTLADSIGAVPLALQGTAPAYRQAMTGLTRLGVRWTDGLLNSDLNNTTTAPNPATTSLLMLAYLDFPSVPAATREILRTAGTNSVIRWLSTGRLRVTTSVSTDGLISLAGLQGWCALRVNITASTISVFSFKEKIVGTFAAPFSAPFTMIGGGGGAGGPTAAIGYPYTALFSGTAAELTDAQVKTLLQTLGAVIPWT